MSNGVGDDRGDSATRVLTDVMVSMRDDVALATDIYLPGPTPDLSAPVLMERTPYNKNGVSRSETSFAVRDSVSRADVARFLARHGYVVVMQDCRGRYKSEGEFTKYVNEAHDGIDTVQWILGQDWCNGQIGTMGFFLRGTHAIGSGQP